MDTVDNIMVLSTFVIIFVSWISTTFKTGLISFSPQSSVKSKHPKFEVDKSKIGRFSWAILTTLVVTSLYFLILTNEVGTALILGPLNTLFISYGLTFWLLLKERDSK